MTYMAPINLPTSEPRYAYQYVEFKLDGDFTNTYYTGSMTGTMDISEVKYFTITAGPNAPTPVPPCGGFSELVGVNQIIDKSDLDALYQANKDKTQGDYTDASWADFVAARDAAKAALDNPNATQKDVDDAFDGLTEAIVGLETETPVGWTRANWKRLQRQQG